jgi:hypothetical protein
VAILVHVRLNGLYVGQVMIYSWAAVEGERMDGQFGYQFDFSQGFGRFFVPRTGDQYKFYATRVD